ASDAVKVPFTAAGRRGGRRNSARGGRLGVGDLERQGAVLLIDPDVQSGRRATACRSVGP
ncbi:MAG: hypothetical protein ACRDRZ_18125, partial [Pseudonocardiaceae bacterium]